MSILKLRCAWVAGLTLFGVAGYADPIQPCSNLPGSPAAPTAYAHGNLTVLEGNVIEVPPPPATPCFDMLGMHASVDVTVPSTGDPVFVVAWEGGYPSAVGGGLHTFVNQIFVSRFDLEGNCLSPGPVPLAHGFDCVGQFGSNTHVNPSIAVSREGEAFVSWLTFGYCAIAGESGLPTAQINYGPFDVFSNPASWPNPTTGRYIDNPNDAYVSAGVNPAIVPVGLASWVRPLEDGHLLRYQIGDDDDYFVNLCPDTGLDCYQIPEIIQPCLSARSDGYFVIAWANPEHQDTFDFHTDIFLQLFAPAGTAVGNPLIINQTELEQTDTLQRSVAVSFDDAGNIVCTWSGPRRLQTLDPPVVCFAFASYSNIYVRAFHWDGDEQQPITAVSDQFTVDQYDVDYASIHGDDASRGDVWAHPTVALSKANDGRFVVAWNTERGIGQQGDPPPGQKIFAQYFQLRQSVYGETGVRPFGKRFRVNQQDTMVEPGTEYNRELAASGQHTAAYAADGTAIFVWHKDAGGDTGTQEPNRENEQVFFTIFPPGFDAYLESLVEDECCKGDINGDGYINGLDIQPFILLWGVQNPIPCDSFPNGYYQVLCAADLNDNGIVDDEDIDVFVEYLLYDQDHCTEFRATVADCNENGLIDAVDLSRGTSNDCNGNFIPDECEPGCGNNYHGMPDECVLAQSLDTDCNENGVPDACDLMNPKTGFDCNRNGIIDSCEIASDPSLDCNQNGYIDLCDIRWGVCTDENQNDICDECETELDGFGQQPSSYEQDNAEAWQAFHAWCAQQTWGLNAPIETDEQFGRMIDKMRELGLPLTADWQEQE